MLIHEEISTPDTVSKLPVARNAELQVARPPLRATLLFLKMAGRFNRDFQTNRETH